MKNKLADLFLVFLVPLLFLIVGISTLSDYGINWDEPMHFNRGQAYLHYFLTGKTNFLDLPGYPELKGATDFRDIRGEDNILYRQSKKNLPATESKIRRSYYQSDVFNYEYFITNDSGHPPLNGILAAISNNIFYQKLGILGDIESYHLFEVFISFLLVLAVAFFVYYNFGIFPSLVSSTSLALYPLFFSESHFNIKDPVEASFFAVTIILFYLALTKRSLKLLFSSSLVFGFSLGTKFNAFFIPIILGIWLTFSFLVKRDFFERKRFFLVSILIFFVVGVTIFYLSWPYLWVKPESNLFSIINYYKVEGIGSREEMNRFLFMGWNTYPLVWIIYTTPLIILILSFLGIVRSLIYLFVKKDNLSLLVLLWLFISILRVSLPNTVIYGGVRQIMEYIPAMMIMVGIGVYGLFQMIDKIKAEYKWSLRIFLSLIVVILYLQLGWQMIKQHPNQNVYFNFLIGGLSGAKQKNIPSWGNSYGNAYYQAIQWLNKNAEKNAKLGLPLGNMINIPRYKLRADIDFSNEYFSGYAKQGEYQIELSYDYPPKNQFTYTYLETNIEPVYEVKVDGVTIAKVWKNDLAHTKKVYVKKEIVYQTIYLNQDDRKIIIDIGKSIDITKLLIKHEIADCLNQKGGFLAISDDKNHWIQMSDPIEYPQMNRRYLNLDKDTFFYLFVNQRARYILVSTEMNNSCLLKNSKVEIYGAMLD